MARRKTTIVMVWDCVVTDDELTMGGEPLGDLCHLVNNIPDFVEGAVARYGSGVYELSNVTVYEAEQFGAAIGDAIKRRKGGFA